MQKWISAVRLHASIAELIRLIWRGRRHSQKLVAYKTADKTALLQPLTVITISKESLSDQSSKEKFIIYSLTVP